MKIRTPGLPRWLLGLSEGPRALSDITGLEVARPFLSRFTPDGDGHPVILLPGLFGSDESNLPLARHLDSSGYSVSGWTQGANLGWGNYSESRFHELVSAKSFNGKAKVSLIGHSLGGIYAREFARKCPDLVLQVITLGSPFNQSSVHSDRLGESREITRNLADQAIFDLAIAPPVPTTAIYTRWDGIVDWRTTVQRGDYPDVTNIEVPGSHIALHRNPVVWYWIGKLLHVKPAS